MSYEKIAENEVIGALIKSEDFISDHIEKLTAEDFLQAGSKIVFKAIQELYFSGKPVNEQIIYASLTAKERKVVSLSTLLEIGGGYVSDLYAKPHFEVVKDLSAKRKLAKLLERANSMLTDSDSGKVIDLILQGVDSITETEDIEFFSTMTETMEKIVEEIDTGKNDRSLKTGFSNIDYHTNGFYTGDMIVVGGRPSMGKTAFALSLMDRMAKNGYKSLIFEMEMADVKLGKRLIAQASHTEVKKLFNLTHDTEELSRVVQAIGRYENDNRIFIDTTPSISVEAIRAKVKKYKQKYGIQVVVVDHIGIMNHPKDNENASLTHISKNLKSIAREFDVVMIVISQLNRGVEGRTDKRPMLSDLRASGSIEQDADMVMLVYRDSYYRQNDSDYVKGAIDVMEVNIAKGRDVGTALFKFGFNEKTQYIGEMGGHE